MLVGHDDDDRGNEFGDDDNNGVGDGVEAHCREGGR